MVELRINGTFHANRLCRSSVNSAEEPAGQEFQPSIPRRANYSLVHTKPANRDNADVGRIGGSGLENISYSKSRSAAALDFHLISGSVRRRTFICVLQKSNCALLRPDVNSRLALPGARKRIYVRVGLELKSRGNLCSRPTKYIQLCW
jgi:hypothetical protein